MTAPRDVKVARWKPSGYSIGMRAEHEGDYVLFHDHARALADVEADRDRWKAAWNGAMDDITRLRQTADHLDAALAAATARCDGVESPWHRAKYLVPDSSRKVIVLVANDSGRLKQTEARYSEGWRFINPKDWLRRPERVRAWMDIPWWNSNEQANPQDSASKPAGTKARPQSEAETQERRRADRYNAPQDFGLSSDEAEGLTEPPEAALAGKGAGS